jgi:hypothetical protein
MPSLPRRRKVPVRLRSVASSVYGPLLRLLHHGWYEELGVEMLQGFREGCAVLVTVCENAAFARASINDLEYVWRYGFEIDRAEETIDSFHPAIEIFPQGYLALVLHSTREPKNTSARRFAIGLDTE